jgi:hypothetical protein
MKYMVFYREFDNSHYLFNEQWPIGISVPATSFGKHAAGSNVDKQIEYAEKHIKELLEVLNSRKRTFTIDGLRYVIIHRGEIAD